MASSSVDDVLAEINAQVLEQRELIRGELHEFVDRGVDFAQSIAPVGGAGDPHPGQFRDSIHGEDREDRRGLPAASIVSNLPTAGFIEFGTEKTPEHGTFAKTRSYLQDQADDARVTKTRWDRSDLG